MTYDVVKVLQDLGFTEYEAKAYLALLETSPLSGYAVSRNSGVPRSKIYQVLGGMVSRGDIMMSQDSTPLYVPLSPGELITQRRNKTQQIFSVAQDALDHYTLSSKHRENIWNISGDESILNRVIETIKGAKERILLEIWQEEAEKLRDVLKQMAQSGVEILIVAYGELDFDFAKVYQHDMSEQITSDYGGRWIVLSVDDQEVVAGIVSLGEESLAAWTIHPGLVMPITEVIIHDIYIMEMLYEFRPQLEAKFGPNLIDLRNKFLIGSGRRHIVNHMLKNSKTSS